MCVTRKNEGFYMRSVKCHPGAAGIKNDCDSNDNWRLKLVNFGGDEYGGKFGTNPDPNSWHNTAINISSK